MPTKERRNEVIRGQGISVSLFNHEATTFLGTLENAQWTHISKDIGTQIGSSPIEWQTLQFGMRLVGSVDPPTMKALWSQFASRFPLKFCFKFDNLTVAGFANWNSNDRFVELVVTGDPEIRNELTGEEVSYRML